MPARMSASRHADPLRSPRSHRRGSPGRSRADAPPSNAASRFARRRPRARRRCPHAPHREPRLPAIRSARARRVLCAGDAELIAQVLDLGPSRAARICAGAPASAARLARQDREHAAGMRQQMQHATTRPARWSRPTAAEHRPPGGGYRSTPGPAETRWRPCPRTAVRPEMPARMPVYSRLMNEAGKAACQPLPARGTAYDMPRAWLSHFFWHTFTCDAERR